MEGAEINSPDPRVTVGNEDFSDEYRRIAAMESYNLTGDAPLCGPIYTTPNFNIFTHEIKVDTRFNDQISKITGIRNDLTCGSYIDDINNINNVNGDSGDSGDSGEGGEGEKDKEFESKYKILKEVIPSFTKEMMECRNTLQDLEKKIEKASEENRKDVELIQTFLNFIMTVNDSTRDKGDLVPDNFHEEILSVCDKIKEKNSFKEVKEEYKVTKKRYSRYLDLLVTINNLNTGNLCSVCIQNTVSSYYNPCGHTTCDTCRDRLVVYSGSSSITTGCKCPICRVDIRGSHKIFFN
jgi:hypothetical protein